MEKKTHESGTDKRFPLVLSIILVFSILGAVVFSVSRKMSREMSASAIQNLNENLDLIKYTVEAIWSNQAEFQKLMAQEIAIIDEDLEDYIRSYQRNETIAKISLIRAGESEGISSTGEVFSEEGMDFSSWEILDGLEVSHSYLNYMGTWAYSIKCPVVKNGEEIGTLYVEYTYDAIDRSLPNGFYNKQAILYIMDTKTERFVLKPKGVGERNAGHLNLEDFYRANEIHEESLREEIKDCVENRKNIMFYHDIREKDSLNFMWMMNGGTICLVGYVPTEAIQQEAKTVNYNILVVVTVMMSAFFLCCSLYYFNQKQQKKIIEEQEREREKYNKQLTEALHAAQLASNAKTTFLSNMSHDIRTPMNAVIGFTTLLVKDAENPDKVREYARKIMISGQHLLSLINDILEVSKIESGKVVLTREEFNLNDLIYSVDTIIRPMASAKSQEFHVGVANIKHEYLLGDTTRMNQILMNLLSNAVKYTQEGGNIWFRIIGLKQYSNQFERIRIEVEDDGYGMTKEYLKTIFDVFTRAENSTTNKVQGTGLGMAITKNIVELMGGTIEVFSEVDKGSLFQVELELGVSENQADKLFWENSGISRILFVEENIQETQNIQTFMEDMGISMDIVFHAEEALDMIQDTGNTQKGYHLVLADWNTLNPGGIQMAEKLRKALPETVILLFMAPHDENNMEGLLQLGYTGILTKPVFVSALREKITEIQAEKSREDKRAETEAECSLNGLNFLAAEDNEINAEILAEILSIEGAKCEIVENGRLALERFMESEEGEFDAILMDVQMPVMNGYDATRAIRKLTRKDADEIPIIAMTANAFAEDEKEALNAGMNIHLAKPIDIERLKKVIRQYVIKK